MSNSILHTLPYPIYNARYTLLIPYLDADGDPTDPTTPDTEISKDAGTFADCTEEVTTISGSNGSGYITLTGAEMKCVAAAICAKVASGPKATLAFLQPRVLPIIHSGTAQAGGNTSITLQSTAPAYDLTGCFARTTGGTGGGGTDGVNNQARMITAYDVSTKIATVFPAWETNPSSDTTYDILLSDLSVNAPVTRAIKPATDGRSIAVDSNGRVDLSLIEGSDATDQINAACDTAISDAGVTTARMSALTDWLDGGRLDILLDALISRITDTRAGYLDNLSGGAVALASGVTVSTNNDKTGYALSASGVSAVQSGLSTLTAQQVWEYATRTLTSVGTLISDIWGYATRTLTEFSFSVTASNVTDKTGYSLSVTPPTAAQIRTEIDSNSTQLSAIKAKTDNLPSGIKKGVAIQNFAFVLKDSSDHFSGLTSATVSGYIKKDAGSFTALTGTITEVNYGIYVIDEISASEMNADILVLRFAATGADDCIMEIKTV